MAQVAPVYSFTSGNMASLMTGFGISSMYDCIIKNRIDGNILTKVDRVFFDFHRTSLDIFPET
jgi:hypothetical protein